MGLSHSPSIVTNGLVFAYDMGNPQKSWKGAPAVNLITNPTNEVIATVNEFAVFQDLSPIFDAQGPGTYSISADIKTTKPGPITVYTASGSVEYNIGYYTANCETYYKRFYFNNINVTRTDPAVSVSNLSFYGTYGTGVFPSIKNVQVEKNSFSTPFVNGTRSNTQAIVDLTNNNTITANSLTYASDNTFRFNGSNSLTIPYNSSLFTFNNEQTIIIWMKNEATVAARRNPYNQAYGGAGTITHESNTYFNYFYGTSGTDNVPYTNHGSPFSVILNETAQIAITRNISQTAWYKNGVLGSAQGNPYGATVVTGTSPISLGTGYAGGFDGSLYNIQIYNRALSAAEIQQNFNALRGRFGL